MKKKQNSFFRSIAKSFDRRIVVPLTRVVLKLTKFFTNSSQKLENILARTTTLLFLSLVLSVLLFIVIDQQIISLTTNRAVVLRDQKVEVLYNEERFVLTGVPETADVTLIGSKADLFIANQSSNRQVTLDLTNIREPGTYRVDFKFDGGLSSIDYSVNPSQVTIIVYERETRNKTLSYKVLNVDALESAYEVSSVRLNLDRVVISGADFQIAQVASVEALIDVNQLTTVTPGTHTLEEIVLRAYDSAGKVVDVDIHTERKVTAEIEITSTSRTVPLNFVPVNAPPFGSAISGYTFSQNTVTVYGSVEVLDRLARTGIDIRVDVSRLTENHTTTVEIPMETGVRRLSANRVTVDIRVTSSGTPVTLPIAVEALNAEPGFIASGAGPDDSSVLVDISGAAEIINNLRNIDIQAFVDVSGITTPGVHTLPVQIRANTANARLAVFVPRRATVRIVISRVE